MDCLVCKEVRLKWSRSLTDYLIFDKKCDGVLLVCTLSLSIKRRDGLGLGT